MVRRAVTRNTLANAMMRRWSDHARLAREQQRAFALTQMTEKTAMQCWRDLLVQDIDLPALWRLIVDTPTPLFRARPSRFDVTREAGTGTVAGYDISLRRGDALRAFERYVRSDRVYARSRTVHTWRLWVVSRRRPPVDVLHAPICAERKYNEVVIGDGTRAVLKLQENARLVFDAIVFVSDYKAARAGRRRLRREIKAVFPTKSPRKEWTAEKRKLRIAEIKLQAFLWEYRAVYEQALPLRRRTYRGTLGPGKIPIRSAFYKVLNRRYQAAHFWLTQISGRKDQRGADLAATMGGLGPFLLPWIGSQRGASN